jgi:hypothetical protein
VQIRYGSYITKTWSQKGDSSRPISVYATGDITNPLLGSRAGIKFNVFNVALDLGVGLSNLGVAGVYKNDNHTRSFVIKALCQELE